VTSAPDMTRIVVAVDPPGTSSEETAEAGIVVVGRSGDGVGYVLADGSIHGTPHEWGTAAVRLHDEFRADGIVAESNQGGDMVGFTIRECAKTLHRDGERSGASVNYIPVHASRGKYTRAEPIAALYSQNRVRHVGMFAELEDQLASWVPGEKSPDRLDAMVWGLTSILLYGSEDFDIWGGAVPRENSSQVVETATLEGGWFPPSRR
jgi:phage terminase large subunit-like protein